MMLRPALICLVTLASLSSSEYVWTGTEWEWQDPDPAGAPLPGAGGSSSVTLGGGSSVSEGSGNGNTWDDDYDDEDYDDNYTYDDDYEEPVKKKEDKKKFSLSDNNKKDKKKNKNKNNNRNRNSEILPATDDEDLFEGSGVSDFDLPRSNYPESNNNNNFNNPMTPVDPYNTNDNSNVYVDENDDSYDDEYDYDDEDYDDDDISFGSDSNNNYGNNFPESTPKPMDPVINMNNNNNVWNTPQTTERSFTPRVTTTTSKPADHGGAGTDVHKTVPVSRPASFFAQPGILAAVIGGAVVGLLCAILLVMFIVYRMRKKDEGSYALDEPKRSHNVNSYSKPPNREFYA